MILETIRLCADALADPVTGVSALLAAVPRDAGDAEPPAVQVVDETRTGWVARGDLPVTVRTPLVSVTQDGPAEMPGESVATYREASVTLAVRVWAPQVQSEVGLRQLLYTARAVQRSLRAWLSNANEADRTSPNGVYVMIGESWSQSPVAAASEGDDVVSVVTIRVTLTVRDQAP